MKKRIALFIAFALTLAMCFAATGCTRDSEDEKSVHTVTFDYNYDGAQTVTNEVADGEKVSRPANPVREGFNFNGWYLYGNAYDFNAAVTEDITIEAYWRDSAIIDEPEAVTYGVAFEEAEGVTYDFGGAKPEDVTEGSEVKFALKQSPYYVGAPVVKANGELLTADKDGAYSFTANQYTTVTVEGLKSAVEDIESYEDISMSGKGTAEDPFTISTPLQWVEFAYKANNFLAYKSMYYRLGADLDFGGEELPIVDEFSGLFFGDGYTMSNYKISYTEVIDGTPQVFTTVGPFGYLGSAYIVNLNLENFKIDVCSDSAVCVGGIAAMAANSDIIGCNVSGEISYTNTSGYIFYVGGIVGQLAGTSEGNASMVTMCTADVLIRGDATGTVGGVAGAMYGSAALSPAFIANSAVSGSITGGTSGGFVGEAGPYSSVADCYFTGTVKADSSEYQRVQAEAGGIIGLASSVEVAVSGCVGAGTVIAKAYTPEYESSDALVGSIGSSRFSSAPVYAAQTLIYNSYRMINGSLQLYDGAAYAGGVAVDDFAGIDALLGWVDDYWTVAEEDLFPEPDASKYSAQSKYAVTVNFPGETIITSDSDISDSYVTSGNARAYMFYPVSFVMGTDGIMLDSRNAGHLSTGFYKDGVRLPAAYLLSREDAVIQLGFSDYTELSGISVYTLASGREYEISVGVGGEFYMARFASGAKVADVPFVYFGDGEMLFPSIPAEFSSGAAYAVIDWEAGEVYIIGAEGQIAVARPYNEYTGVWYDSGVTFLFNVDGSGLFVLGGNIYSFEYAVDANGVVLYIGGHAVDRLDYAEGKLVGGGNIFTSGVSLGREDNFAGYYETDMYSGRIVVAFDGYGSFAWSEDDNSYSYTVEGGKAVVAGLGASFEFDEDGMLVLSAGDEQIAGFGKRGSVTGVWSNPTSGYMILFTGITDEDFGVAADSLGNVFRYEYSSSSDTIYVYYGANLYARARLGTIDGMYVLVYETSSGTSVLYLDDNFNGVWHSDESDESFVFMYGLAQVITEEGESEVVTYAYVDGDMNVIAFTVGETEYVAYFDEDNMQVLIDGVSYVGRDEFAGVDILSDDGMTEMVFDGNGKYDKGALLLYDYTTGARTVLAYRMNSTGAAVVFEPEDDEEIALFTVSFDEVKGLYLIKYADNTTEYYGVSNMFTGDWSVRGNFTLKISVGALNVDYEGKAVLHLPGTDLTVDVRSDEDGVIVLYSDMADYYAMQYSSQYGMTLIDLDNDNAYSMALTDEMSGVWTDGDGSTLTFDGAGYNNSAYLGVCRYAAGGSRKDYYYGISSQGLSMLYVELSSGTYQYFTFLRVSADMYDEAAGELGGMISDVFRNVAGDAYIILLGNMSDELTGFTYTTRDEAELEFIGNDMYCDAFVFEMTGYNYVRVNGDEYLYQPVEADDGVYVIYAYSLTSLAANKYTPDYVITVYTDGEGNPESAEIAEYSDAMIYEGMFSE